MSIIYLKSNERLYYMVSLPYWPIMPWPKNKHNNLEAFKKLLHALDNPHLKLPPTIHIAGTNGKGSSCAYLKTIFTYAGYKAHVYTSPHLVEYNERIVLAGELITDHFLFELTEIVRIKSEQHNIEPSFFEATTAIAFLAFSRFKADILILETGIGGRLDATNVIENPLLTLISSISYDHMNILGDNLELIANEKAGIIKPGVPCVISAQTTQVYQVLLNKCAKLGSPAFCYEYDYGIIAKTANSFIYSSRNLRYEFPQPSLPGDHQLINAAGIVAAISLINQKFQISSAHISEGLQNTCWPARIQKIDSALCNDLVHSRATIWLDGAHNSAGALALANWLKQNLIKPIYLILGMTKGRDIQEFCSHFTNLISKGYGVQVLSEASSYNSEAIVSQARLANLDFETTGSIADALYQISLKDDKKCNIIICGSLFLAADFLKLVR